MSLFTMPKLTDGITREQIEEHIETVRLRRLAATVQYHNLRNAKLEGKAGKLGERFDRNMAGLEKDLLALERLEEKVEERLNMLESLTQEMTSVLDARVEVSQDEPKRRKR